MADRNLRGDFVKPRREALCRRLLARGRVVLILAGQGPHWRRVDRLHVRGLRRLFQAHESPVLRSLLDRLVVLCDTRDALPRRMDADGPALETAGAAVSASTYDVARSVGASAHIRPRRGRGVSPHPPVVPPQTSD